MNTDLDVEVTIVSEMISLEGLGTGVVIVLGGSVVDDGGGWEEVCTLSWVLWSLLLEGLWLIGGGRR